MTFLVSANLNHAHEQAMSLWDKLTKSQDRRLWVTMENRLGQTLKTYGHDTYSSKCRIIQGGGFDRDEDLPAGKFGLCIWQGSVRITGVVALYLETHPAGGAAFDPLVQRFAREVVIFKAYSLVSRAGKNVVHCEATVRNGAITNGQFRAFDYSDPFGGYGEAAVKMSNTFVGQEMTPAADYVLGNDARLFDLKNYSDDCYHIPESAESESFTSQPPAVAWDGQKYEITNEITGRHFCDAKVIVRHAV